MKFKILVVSVSTEGKGGVVTVVNTLKSSEYLNENFYVSYHSSHSPKSVFVKIFSMLWAYLKFSILLYGIDVVHIHGSMKTSFFRKSPYLLISKLFGKKVIYHMHAAMVSEYFENVSSFKLRFIRKIFSLYDLRVCLGVPWVKVLEDVTGSRWEVLHNPMSPAKPCSLRSVDAECQFVFLGELSARKGVEDLLHAFSLGRRAGLKACLKVAGNGDIERLSQLCKELDITQSVEFLGWICAEEKHELLCQSDVVVLPSYAEGLPMSVLEGMSYGRLVIATPVGATEDAIHNGVNGILVNPGDVNALSHTLCKVANDSKLRGVLGSKALDDFMAKFHVEVISQKLGDYYLRLVRL